MSKMFAQVTRTWNPVKGCLHNCYLPRGCWAYQLATGRLKNSERYKDGFAPNIIRKEFVRNLGKNQFIAVCFMGDLFGDWVKFSWIVEVIRTIRMADKSNKFLLLTKNPKRYMEILGAFQHDLPSNIFLGATIESNRNLRAMGITNAPDPIERYDWMRVLKWENKAVCIEPVIDFDLNILVKMIRDINPKIVWVGYDNHCCGLPEPALSKTLSLIKELEKFTNVHRKTLREAEGNGK